MENKQFKMCYESTAPHWRNCVSNPYFGLGARKQANNKTNQTEQNVKRTKQYDNVNFDIHIGFDVETVFFYNYFNRSLPTECSKLIVLCVIKDLKYT